ncbi:MAG TPA: hypothetical protein VIY28_01875 [Pseudonocardiaceae bacterium]
MTSRGGSGGIEFTFSTNLSPLTCDALEMLHEDLWIYDDEIAVRMIYDEEGHFLHPEPANDIERYREMRDIAMRHAEPLNDYLARKNSRQRRSE